MNNNIRFVRCPKCRLVLQEPSEVPVYQCGGCGALLQAKNRKTDANDGANLNLVQTSPAPKPAPEHASEEEIVATNLNQQSTTVSSKQADKDQHDSTDSGTEKPSCINHSEEARSSTDISSHENPESSPEAGALMNSDTDTCHPDQDDTRDQNECSDSDKEQHVDISVSGGTYSSPEAELNNYYHDSESSSVQIEVDEENVADRKEVEDSSRELPDELTSHEVEESTRATVLDTEVEEKLMKGSDFRSLVAEKLMDSIPRKLASSSQNLVDEDVERFHTAKTLEGTSFNKPSRDLGVLIGDRSKSPIASSYDAYDSSVSSFDGNHDQVADSHLIPRRRNYIVRSKEFPKGDVFRSKLGRNQNEMNRGQWPHEFPVPMRQALTGDDARSRAPFHERGSRTSHEDASTSSLGFSEFQYNSMYQSLVKPDNLESEKLELLRMVHQLQDQLKRTSLLTGNPSGGFPTRVAMKGKQISSSYYHSAAEREMQHDLSYSRYPVQYGQGKSWSHQFNPSRTAFSGETQHNRGQIDCFCFHCRSQDRHYSAQLPPRDIYRIKECYGTHYSPYQSGPTSPQHHNSSEYSSWSQETKSNDQWHRKDLDMKTRQPPKRHFRPLAGGSPMVACYLCSKILQLPADFLVFRRRYHSLKCSSCLKVLKFSLLNRNHLIPYIPESETMAPPPSEADEYPDLKKERILESVFRATTSYAQHAASVSYSDDYGQAYSKDYSAETDPASVPAPFDRKMTSVISSDPMAVRKKLVQSSVPGKFSSKKLSSAIEENPARSGSPLHRLMGYASPSRVLRGEPD